MTRRIIGVTVGTPMNPQTIVDRSQQAEQIDENTKNIGELTKQVNDIFIPTKVSELENDKGFITQEQVDLSDYALKSDIPTDYAKKEHLHDEYANKEHEHSQYLTQHQDLSEYALKKDIPTDYAKENHAHDNYSLKDHKHDEYLTEHQSLEDYALKNEIPSKTSELTNDSGFITTADIPSIPTKVSELNNDSGFITINDIPEQEKVDLSGYALKSEIPTDYAKEEHTHSEYAHKEHTHEQYLTEHQDLSSYAKISDVTTHNTSSSSHNDIRLLIDGLTTRLNALANSDDTTLDQMAEIVEYIKNNKSLIDNVTTSKVNVSDIIDNLTTSVANQPLSAKQGVVLKGFIDDLTSVVDGKAPKEHTHSQYLTQHQDLSGYALKTDIPEINDSAISTVDTWSSQKISNELANAGSVKTVNGVKPDANGNVEIQVSAEDVGVDLSNYYTKTEIDNTIGALDIPEALSELTSDSTHRVVTDVQISAWNAKSNFSGSYTDLTNQPTLGTLASKNTVAKTDLASDVQTSLGKADTALQSFTETDPTVPAWAKASTKPTYTASEVGAVPTTRTVNGKALSGNITLSASDISDVYSTSETDNKISGALSTHNSATDAHSDIRTTLAAVKEDVDAFFKDATISAEAKDTLKEIQDYIISDVSAAAEMTASINNKVDKVSGKGLSTNDLTVTLKSNYDVAYTHTSNKSNPHGVTLSQLDVTATAAELNVLDGITATVTELNYVDGVTSNVQTQLNAKVPTSRTINGKALSSNITLSASDVGAYSKTEVDDKLAGQTAIQIITWEAGD